MDILMGADNRRIRETGFQHLPTYGVGKDRTRRFWKYLIDALTRQGLAAIEGEEYPYLRITETGWETLRGAPVPCPADRGNARPPKPGGARRSVTGHGCG